MKKKLSNIFNTLSPVDRLALHGAAAMKTITADFRDDTKAHPWKFPFYATYVLAMIAPLPVPFHGVGMAALVVLYARAGLTPGARELHSNLREAFDETNLIREHRGFLRKLPDEHRTFGVRKWKLTEHAAGKSLHNLRRLTGHAFRAAADLFKPKPDGNEAPRSDLKPPENGGNQPVP